MKQCLVYLDDVLIFSNKLDDNIKHVYEMITTLEDARVKLNIAKIQVFQGQVGYLGLMIKPSQL